MSFQKIRTLVLFLSALVFVVCIGLSGCSKSNEQTGDAFLASAEKVQNPKAKEEREKKAYLKYLDAVTDYMRKGQTVPPTLRVKILKLTLSKLNREFSRLIENPEEANIDQMNFWRQDFQKFLPGLNDPALVEGYSQFLLSYANPDFMSLGEVMDVLNEVVAMKVRAADAQQKIRSIQAKFAGELVMEAQRIYSETVAALKTKTGNKDNLVKGEYKILQAVKYDPTNEKALTLLSEIRVLMLDTYSGYERFQDEMGGTLDPDIDKYDIYLCVAKKNITKKDATMTVSLWNLTATPITVNYDYFFLISDNNDTVPADKATKFHKITLDTKTDSAQSVVFKLPNKNFPIRNLLYKDGNKISEKFFH